MDSVGEETGLAFRCSGCGSIEVDEGLVRSAFWEGDRLVVVEGIPALVCGHCGEQFYDDTTAMRLDLMRGSGFPADGAKRAIEVPVFDFGAPLLATGAP